MRRLTTIILISLVVLMPSCKKFLEVELPKSQVVEETVFKTDATAISAISGIYYQMRSIQGFASGSYNSTMLLAAYSADELVNYNNGLELIEFYSNSLQPRNSYNYQLWGSAFEIIYACNAVLEGLSKSTGVTDAVKKQLEGEALFIRAFSYFYLVNFYGDVPLITTTDYRINQSASRASARVVYDQIIADLIAAQSKLSAEYPTANKVRVNKITATAMLARVYLYTAAWDKAVTQATTVINDSRYGIENDLGKVFLANSNEAIWQMMNPNMNGYTAEGILLILNAAPGLVSPAALDSSLVKSFTANDKRRSSWVDSFTTSTNKFYYPAKYKRTLKLAGNGPEYTMVIRLAEMYLIRAEARAKQNQLVPAIADLDVIRSRANIPLIAITNPGISQSALLLAIEQERRLELFTEWGHRWFDLKRTDRANAVLGVKPNWQVHDVLYPIPETEMLNNPNLKPQNPGY